MTTYPTTGKTTYENGKKVYRETFVSPFERSTRAEAFRVLDAISEAHPASSGWKEISGYVEQLPNGKWRAVRVHEKHYS